MLNHHHQMYHHLIGNHYFVKSHFLLIFIISVFNLFVHHIQAKIDFIHLYFNSIIDFLVQNLMEEQIQDQDIF